MTFDLYTITHIISLRLAVKSNLENKMVGIAAVLDNVVNTYNIT